MENLLRHTLVMNQYFKPPSFAVGQTDVADYIVREAMDENLKLSPHPVFQVIGNLSQPVLISHIEGAGVRTVFDFRTQYVYFEDQKKWLALDSITDPERKRRANDLILDWERIRLLDQDKNRDYIKREIH